MARTWKFHPPPATCVDAGKRYWDRRLRHCPGRRFRSADSYPCRSVDRIKCAMLRCMSLLLADFVAEVGDDRCVATGANFFK